jgi:hypothetical protein
MVKMRPLLPQSYEWLNIFCDNLTFLYNAIGSKSIAIPEPSRIDAKGSYNTKDWDDVDTWSQVDELGLEYVMMYNGDNRFLWYRYSLSNDKERKDKPHLTFGFGFGSSRHADGYQLDPVKRVASEGGTSTAAASGSLTDSSATWGVNDHTGKWVQDAEEHEYYIISNTATVLTLNTTSTPDTGPYIIWDKTGGANMWNVIDLQQVRQLIPGMILSVHSVRCAMIRDVSS